ncbi:MAG: glycosyltransferase [Bacteroidota bacterium]
MVETLLTISFIVLLVDLALIILWLFNYKEIKNKQSETPFVSILIAARDEENNLADCLEAILKVNYPEDKLEILLGNDRSEDKTGDIAEAYAVRHPQIKSYQISARKIKGNGKANALAQLARKAKGEYMLITDADIVVPPDWIKSMLVGLDEDTALVTGTSIVGGNTMIAYFQKVEWLFATGMLKVVSDFNVPVTTMGNNMLIRKSVYEEIGGYEALPFSVTEDLELFNHIKKKHKTVNLFNDNVLNISKPQSTFMDLLVQRKRWMRGAFRLPWIMVALLALQSSFFLVIVGLFMVNTTWAWIILGVKFMLRYIFGSLLAKKLKESINIVGYIIFEVYAVIFSSVSVLYYFLSGPVEWKGRKY